MPVNIKRFGNSGVVYIDDSGRPMPIANYDDEPVGGFPFTDSLPALLAKFGQDVVFIDNPAPPPPVDGAEISDSAVVALAPKYAERYQNKPIAAAPTPPPNSNSALGANLSATVLDTFKDMLIRHSYAKGKDKKELARDIEAVASFLITCDSSYEAQLVSLKDSISTQTKRFSL